MGAEWRSSVHEPHVWPIVILGGGGMMRDGGCRSRNGSRGVLFRYCRGGAWQKIFDFPIHRRMQICTGKLPPVSFYR